MPIRIPPLRERTEDIPELVRHFQKDLAAEGLPAKSLNPAAMKRLKAYKWPGNVRELENLVRRLAALYSHETIGIEVSRPNWPRTRRQRWSRSSGEASYDGLAGLVERHLAELFRRSSQ